MLRTIVVRSNLLREPVRKVIKPSHITRTLSIECSKRKNFFSKPLTLQTEKHLQWQQRVVRRYSSNLPSHTKVVLPALSPTMSVGNIVRWEKKEGDKLNEGDLLAEIETDKATMGFETPEEGYLAKIIVQAGTKGVPIGQLVCIIVENQADVAAFKDFKDDATPEAPKAAPATTPTPTPSAPKPAAAPPKAPEPAAASDRVYASPMAKRLAEQRQIRLQGKGTGLYGSITSSDLDHLAAAPGAAAATPSAKPKGPSAVPSGQSYVDIPLSNMREVIAKRLLESKIGVPHYYVTVEINVDKILALRQKINKQHEKSGVKVSVNDFIIKATAMASMKLPEVNSWWMNTVIRQFKDVDVSVAVATDTGLITPIVFEANNKGVVAISKEMKTLAEKARLGKLQPQEFQGGTICVSNLGMFGVTHFTAIINPPQSSILAIGSTQNKLVPDDSEKGFKKVQVMNATLSSDHRVIDGALAARWLSAFREHLEDPVSMIL